MNKPLLHIALAALLILASCSLETKPDVVEGSMISLSASVGASTKAIAQMYSESVPSESSPLTADIWFSTTSGQYAGNTQTAANGVSNNGSVIDSHRTIIYKSGNPTIPSGINDSYLRYPSGGGSVYCVGMAPQGLWSTSDGITATASIDGLTDMMFAKQIEGSDSDKLTYKQQDFEHLLTLVRIRVRAAEVQTSETWGALHKISIDAKDVLAVTLADGSVGFSNSGANDAEYVVFSGTRSLSTVSAEFGSALVAPVVADGGSGAEYTIHVQCENHSKDVPVSLTNADSNPFSGNTAGHVFVVTLCFRTLDYIEGTVELKNWDEEYRDITLN